MKTALILLIGIISFSGVSTAGIELSEEQYENLAIINRELRKKDTNFEGLSGSREKMEVYGISDDEAMKTISSMNFKELKQKDPEVIRKNALIEKFKALSFDAEMLAQIGLGEAE